MRRTVFAVLLLGLGALPASGQSNCHTLPEPNPDPRPGGQVGCSVNVHSGLMALGANLDGAGSVTPCHQGADGKWTCESKLKPDDQTKGEFGKAVAIDDTWLAVGAPGANGPRASNSGLVYVYRRIDGAWAPSQKLSASDAASGDGFGATLARSGDTLLVGAPSVVGNAGSLSGAVYVFHRNGDAWVQGQKLTADDARAFDSFGFSLAIDGNTVVIGAPFHDGVGGNSGEAYVFEWNGTTWSQTARLTANDAAAGDEFGSAVAVRGDTLAVGARRDDVNGLIDVGSVYMYDRQGTGWKNVDHLPGPSAGGLFGTAVSLSGDQLLIGAMLHNGSGPESGAAYLYKRQQGQWVPQAFSFPASAPGDRFGQAVAIDGSTLLVGAYLADFGAPDAGSATVCGPEPEPSVKLNITKDDGFSQVSPDQTITYTITVTQNGSQTIPAVQVTDVFRTDLLRDIHWCAPEDGPKCPHPHSGDIDRTISLPPQGVTFTVTATVRHDASGVLRNKAYAQIPGSPESRVWAEDRDQIVSVSESRADLEIFKTGPASAKPKQRITYTLTVTNLGPDTATGVHLEDLIPAGLQAVPGDCLIAPGKVICNLPDLPFPGGETVNLQFDVLETCLPSIMNRATVSANEKDPDLSNNSSSSVPATLVRTSDLAMSKAAPASVKRGDPISYTLTVTNLGPDLACGVLVSDPLPQDLTDPVLPPGCSVMGNKIHCSIAELPVGASPPPSFLVSFTAPAAAPCGSQIVNTATVSVVPPDIDPQPNNDSATATTAILDSLSITKTDGLTTASPGDTLTYTIVVGNPGQCPVTVRDVCPTGLTQFRWCRDSGGPCTPSRPGPVLEDTLSDSAATYRVRGVVAPMFTGTLSNTASATGPSGSVQATDTTEIVLAPGVTVFCKGIDGTQVEGGTVIYTFLLLNGGPAAQMDNPGDEFSDLLPAGLTPVSASASSGVAVAGNPVTWNGAIPVGGMVTITITAMVGAGTKGMTFCNAPTIAFDQDGDGANESHAVAVPCCFTVPATIPTLTEPWLAALGLLLALLALRRLRRRTL